MLLAWVIDVLEKQGCWLDLVWDSELLDSDDQSTTQSPILNGVLGPIVLLKASAHIVRDVTLWRERVLLEKQVSLLSQGHQRLRRIFECCECIVGATARKGGVILMVRCARSCSVSGKREVS